MLEADIALDPFPFNGGTTSCEALWVGLPVISLTTDSFIGRQGLRCLTRTGIADLASDSEEHYVANALKLKQLTEQQQRTGRCRRPDREPSGVHRS